ncbi:MAG TPA: glycosyltransferase [Verrucomicrobiae bacterium]|nr:glycosyltransferase [Verrucomicrobiae bacterium]
MRFFTLLRTWLSHLILRGPFLRWWVDRRGRQWETAYCAELAKRFGQPVASEVAPAVIAPPGELRNILLIADCMWEQNDLVPEFARIAPTRLLDLRPRLKNQSSPTLKELVVQGVREFIQANRDYSPDVILLYARPLLLSDEVFALIRSRWRCPLLGMNLDDKLQFFPYRIFSVRDDNYQHWATRFDLNISNCLPATEWYRERSLPVIYSPQGVHRPEGMAEPTSSAFQHSMSFLGSIKPEREMIINRLQQARVPIKLFGAGWPNSQWVDDANAIFRSTQLNLGIGLASPSLALTTVKGRDFECPGVGACYVTTFNWELPLHYEIGKEILCYRSVEELIEIYAYYHKRPEECLKIARAAWRRCSTEHTWELRFRRIFREVGFSV